MNDESVLVWESHVTVEPVFDERLEEFRFTCDFFKFRVAKLLMRKRENETPVRSLDDSFCTGHSHSKEDLTTRMVALVQELQKKNFHVWRYKIEAVVLDSRIGDELNLLP